MKVVVTEFMDEDMLRAGLPGVEVVYDPELVDKRDALFAEVADADALIVRNRTQVKGALLDAAARLKCIGRLGVGLDNIDTAACKARGIAVYPASGANDISVAEYVIAAALLLMRGAFGASAELAKGGWPRQALMNGGEVYGKRLGLVGFGAIARHVARRAAALGMTVAAHDPFVANDDAAWTQDFGRVEPLGLDALLAASDILSLHVPLTDATRGLIDERALGRMKPGAILINTARGGVADERALARALREGRLGGAALDVFDAEPFPQGYAERFEGLPNLVLTPHIAGLTAEANRRVSELTVANVRRHLAEA
ncbi:hydroxyacid dehydrogenase [Rhodomicrobium sp.]|uniref:hydroxyacid dehydrogenase n=1 Tax=Rhodomicrobium sp. TaxID=2720632 RepID=UPI0039E3640F